MPGFELIGKDEAKAVAEIFNEGGILFAHGFDSLRKKYHVREFESKCSEYFKVDYSVAVASGTAGLKCALKAVGVQQGDEVITQSFNFIATIEAIVDCGAKPVICDIDENLHLSINNLMERITKKTKAIIIVHMLGMGGDIKQVVDLGKKLNLPIIEDNCEAIGAKFNDRYLGTIADIGVMSFDHGKMIACGEGGMVLTNRKEHADFVSQYSDHGHENNPKLPRGKDRRIMPGFNYRLTEIQAAIGKVQLSKLEFMLNENKKRYEILEKSISKFLKIRSELPFHQGSYDTFIFSIKDRFLKQKIISFLKELNFGTKNLPDAMEWHCSFYWQHAIDQEQIINSKNSFEILNNQIALPILLKKSIQDYEKIADGIVSIIS